MITARLGRPGQGKSLTGSIHIKEQLDMGITVYSNLHLNESRANYFYFDTADYEVIYTLQDGVIVFDEGQFLLDARNWSAMPVKFRQLLQKGRHEGLDFDILTQNINQIDVSARRLVHEALLVSKWFSSTYFNIGLFAVWDVDVLNLEKQATQGLPNFIFATKSDFTYYDSYALREKKAPPTALLCGENGCAIMHRFRA